MSEAVTVTVDNGAIAVPKARLAKAGISDGDAVYVDVDEHGTLIVEPTRIYESGEEFLAAIRARIDE